MRSPHARANSSVGAVPASDCRPGHFATTAAPTNILPCACDGAGSTFWAGTLSGGANGLALTPPDRVLCTKGPKTAPMRPLQACRWLCDGLALVTKRPLPSPPQLLRLSGTVVDHGRGAPYGVEGHSHDLTALLGTSPRFKLGQIAVSSTGIATIVAKHSLHCEKSCGTCAATDKKRGG